MYEAESIVISKTKYPVLHEYLTDLSQKSAALYNAALYRIRQRFTGRKKICLTSNEQEVISEIGITMSVYPSAKKPKSVMTYSFLEKLMRATANPDFFNGLPMQTAQDAVRDACDDFDNWLKALKTYKKEPGAFLGKPKMPHYNKSGKRTFCFTNQDCVIKLYKNVAPRKNGSPKFFINDKGVKPSFGERFLKFPLTKEVIPLRNHDGSLSEVKVTPYHGDYKLMLVYKVADRPFGAISSNKAAIDLGISNLAAIVTTAGSAVLYKGEVMKSVNQWFNKQRAKYVSALTKGHETKHLPETHRLAMLSKKRTQVLHDYFHKVSSDIVKLLLADNVGTLVLGVNKGWKQCSNISKANNQSFVSMPLATLRHMIAYKSERAGIAVIEQEESYTSKASFLDNDFIPVYGKNDQCTSFSGVRIKRGLYRSADGTILNADINGAANILRKAIPDAFDNIPDFGFLQKLIVKRYRELVPKHKCTPVKGIAAV